MSLAEFAQERSLGRYKLIASLGRGGMANVYLAVSAGLASFNKLLVLKTLRPDASPEFVQMFLDEARLSAWFNHPNIVQTYEVGEAGGSYFIAMEYLEGQSLRAVQRKLGDAFLLEDELRVLAAVARGLDYAHELRDFAGKSLQVVHRDVSPQNVFLTYDGQVKLLDFGIAKATSSDHDTQGGLIRGKVDYIAPEQARGDRVDRRADVFSLGAMIWEAATRQRFSGGHTVGDVTKLHRRLSGSEPDVHEVRPDLPGPLAELIRCALALDPTQRFASAAALAEALESFLESRPVRPSSKTLSDALARPYTEVRVKLRSVIEGQLKRLRQNGSRDSGLLVLDFGDVTASYPGVTSSVRARAPEPRAPATRSIPSVVMAPSQPSPAESGPRAPIAKLAVVLGVVGLAAVGALSGPRPALDATKRAPPAVAVMAAHGAASNRPTAALPAARVAAPTVAVDVRVVPGHAHVELDGTTLPTLPFHGRKQRDGLAHSIEASAPGYVTKTLVFPLDRDRELSVVLQPEVTPAVQAAGQAPVHAAPTRAPARPERARADSTSLSREAELVRHERAETAVAPAVVSSPVVEPGVPLGAKKRWGLHLDKSNPYDD